MIVVAILLALGAFVLFAGAIQAARGAKFHSLRARSSSVEHPACEALGGSGSTPDEHATFDTDADERSQRRFMRDLMQSGIRRASHY